MAYNSGMFDNSHLLIMQYFFWNDLLKFSERLVNAKEEMTKFEWPCAANFEVIRHLVQSYYEGKNPVPLENAKLHNHRIKFKTLNLLYGKEY